MRGFRGNVLCLALLASVVSACGGGSGGAGGGGSFGDLTVSGKVVLPTGDPAPNVAVVIAGRGPFVTDSNGEFLVTDAPVPYDAIVFDGAAGSADVWRGLTRPDPLFTLDFPFTDFPHDVAVDGTVTGGVGLPVPMTHETVVGYGIEGGLTFTSDHPDDVTGAYARSELGWAGPFSSDLYITALQYELDVDGLPSSFTGYGTITAPVSSGDTLINQDIVMGPVATTTVSGTLATPAGLTGTVGILFLGLPGDGALGLPTAVLSAPNFALQAPDAPGVTRGLLLFGVDSVSNQIAVTRTNLPAPAAGLDLSLPSVSGLVFPVTGATGVGHATEFRVTPSPGDRVFTFDFRATSGPGPRIRVHTSSSVVRIPDLSAYGMGLPAGTEYDWSVRGVGPASSVDDAAVERTLLVFLPLLGDGNGFTTASATWTFFVAP